MSAPPPLLPRSDAGGPHRPHRPLWGAVPRPVDPVDPVDRADAVDLAEIPGDAGSPEALSWRPRPTFRERALRAVGVPAAVGGALFAAAVIAGIVIVLVQPHEPDALPDVSGSAAEAGAGAETGLGGAAGSEGSAQAEQERLLVHVVGQVREPGVVELPAGARVRDAIAAAGGATEAAVLTGVNLARAVGDGEQVVVPDAEGAAAIAATGGGASVGGSAGTDGIVDLNAADAAALETLPRVGPALAERILEWRAVNGRFASVDQLLEVSGIGAKTLEGFRDRVRV